MNGNVNANANSIRTVSIINLLAGIWLFVSPWVYGAYSNPSAWNSWIVGVLIALFAAIRMTNPEGARGASIINLLLGAWTFFSPWIYGYTANHGRFINSLCVGVIVFVLGIVASSMGRTATTHHEPPPLRA